MYPGTPDSKILVKVAGVAGWIIRGDEKPGVLAGLVSELGQRLGLGDPDPGVCNGLMELFRAFKRELVAGPVMDAAVGPKRPRLLRPSPAEARMSRPTVQLRAGGGGGADGGLLLLLLLLGTDTPLLSKPNR